MKETIEKLKQQIDEINRKSDATEPSRYRTAEDELYKCYTAAQEKLYTSILGDIQPAKQRALSGVVKDVLGCYSDAVRCRKLADIEAGTVVPVSVLGAYNKQVMPAIATAIDNLRLDIINSLNPDMRAAFSRSWDNAYRKFAQSVQEAALQLQKLVMEAQNEAAGRNPSRTAERKSQSAKIKYGGKRLGIKG